MNPWDSWKINSCRICSNNGNNGGSYSSDTQEGIKLQSLLSLGTQYVSDFVSAEKVYSGIQCPIELVRCEDCGLVQQLYTASQDFMYTRHYWYRSGVTQTMRSALRDVTSAIEGRLDLKPGDVVLDIGSNDGTLLRSYNSTGLIRVGVEPATNLQEEGRVGLDYLIPQFWSSEAYTNTLQEKARAITAIGMMYDLPDPNQFIADVAKVLRPDGVFVAQLTCLRQTLDLSDVGNLVHEHLEFYTLGSLERLYGRYGLEIFDIEENNVNGGSYRVWARLKENTLPPRPAGCLRRLESVKRLESGYTNLETYKRFFTSLLQQRADCMKFIQEVVSRGKRVWVYGASTKGNCILQWYGLDANLIQAAADKSTEKHGKYTVGTGIPIKSCEEFRAASPDYALVLPFAFTREFCKVEYQWLDGGGKFLVPLPSFRVVELHS